MKTCLIENHVALVKSIAGRMASRLPAAVPLGDLIGAGSLGLVNAAERYRSDTAVPFHAYACQRIRGAILDFLRQQDWQTRSSRSRIRHLEEATGRLEQELSRPPYEDELAASLDLSLDDVREIQLDAGSTSLVSLDSLSISGDEKGGEIPFVPKAEADVESKLVRGELLALLCAALRNLPQKECVVLALYYYEDLVMREIGEALGMSEAGISLRHRSALARLRAEVKQHYQMDEECYTV